MTAALDLAWEDRVGDWPTALSFSADGQWLAVGGIDGEVTVFPSSGGKRSVAGAHEGGVSTVAFCPAGDQLATGGADGTLKLWTSSLAQNATVAVGRDDLSTVAWSPNGRAIAAACGRQVFTFDPEGNERGRSEPHPSTVTGLAWRPDSRQYAASAYGGVWLHEPTGRTARQLVWKGSMLSVVWRPGERTDVLACGCQDHTVHFWRLPGGRDAHMSGYASKPRSLSFRWDGTALATSGSAEVCIWPFVGNGPEGKAPVVLEHHTDRVEVVSFAPLIDLLATGGRDGRVALWAPGRRTEPLRVREFGAPVTALAWGTDSRALLLGMATANGEVGVWRMAG